MNTFSDSFRVVLWFLLCLVMAVGMVVFAIIYGLSSYVLRKMAWKEINLNFLSFKLAK